MSLPLRLSERFRERLGAPALQLVKPAGATPYGDWLQQVTPRWRWDWPHLRVIEAALDQVTAGTINRLILELPPRHGKSEGVTVRYPVYRLERDPAHRTIIGAYNQTLASKFSRKARRVAKGRVALSEERKAVEDWETDEGGGVRAVGVGAGVTGHGADTIIIDDPVRSRKDAESPTYRDAVWDWYTDDLYTRLEPGGSVIVISTRWHEDDLIGRILASEDAANWTRIRLPALAEEGDLLGRAPGQALCPDRFDEEALAGIRRVLGTYGFSALYQQRPQPAGGTIFQRGWWRFWRHAPRPPGVGGEPYVLLPPVFSQELTSWDMAFKGEADSDWVVGEDWAKSEADVYLLDEVRGQLDFPDSRRAVRLFAAKHPGARGHYVEDKANGPAIIASLRKEIPGLVAVDNKGTNLLDRARSVAPYAEAGNVVLPDPTQPGYEWVHDWIEEFARFPKDKNDDRVASGVQAVMRLMARAGLGAVSEAVPELPSETVRVARARY